jgi:hypothetical protein
VLLEGLRADLVAGGLEIRSRTIRDALGTFVWKRRRPEAATGFYDDAVFSTALAHYAAGTIPAAAAAAPRRSLAPPSTPEEHFATMRRKRFA